MPERHSLPTVLVVDDDPHVADRYAAWLASDHEVLVAYSGEDALESLAEGPVDVVLLARDLPDISAEEILVSIRDRGIDARVAAVSEPEPKRNVFDVGFDHSLVKPVDRETVLATVERLLAVRPYSEIRRELTELRVERNVLEAELPAARLPDDDQYQELLTRIEDLETQAEDYLSTEVETPALAIP